MVLNIQQQNKTNNSQSGNGSDLGNIFKKEIGKQKSLADQINKEVVKQAGKESNSIHNAASEIKDTQTQLFDSMNPPQSVIDFIKLDSGYEFVHGVDQVKTQGDKIIYLVKGGEVNNPNDKYIVININSNNLGSKFFVEKDKLGEEYPIILSPLDPSLEKMIDLSKIQSEKKRITAELENFSKYAKNHDVLEKDKSIFYELRDNLKKLDAMEYAAKLFARQSIESNEINKIFTDPTLQQVKDLKKFTKKDFPLDSEQFPEPNQTNSMPFPNDTPTTKKSGDTNDEISSTVPGGQMNQVKTKTIPTLENETDIEAIKTERANFKNSLLRKYESDKFKALSEDKQIAEMNTDQDYMHRLTKRIGELDPSTIIIPKTQPIIVTAEPINNTSSTYNLNGLSDKAKTAIQKWIELENNPKLNPKERQALPLEIAKQIEFYKRKENVSQNGTLGTISLDGQSTLQTPDYASPEMQSQFGDETADTINQFGILDDQEEIESISTPTISYTAPTPDMDSDFGDETVNAINQFGILDNEDNEITSPFIVEQPPVTKTESVATSPEDIREMELEKRINASTSIAEIHSILKEFGGINGPMGRISYDDAWSSIRNYFYGSEEYTLPEVFELRSKVIEFKNAFDEREKQRNADLDALGLESGPIRKKGTEPQEMTITPRVNIPVNTVEHDQGDLMKSFLNREYGIDLEDKKLSKLEQLKLNLDQARAKYALMQGEYNKKSYVDRIGAKFANLGQNSSEVTQEVFNAESEYQKIKLEVLQAMAVEGLGIKNVIAFIHEENEKLANALPAKKREIVWKGMKKLGLAGVSVAAFATNTVKDSSAEMLKNLGFSDKRIDQLKPIAPWIGRALLATAMSAGTGGAGTLASLGMTAAKYAGAEAVDTLVLKKAFATDTVEKQTDKIAKNYGEKDLTNTEILKTLEKRVNKSKLYAGLNKTLRAALKIGAGVGTGIGVSHAANAVSDYFATVADQVSNTVEAATPKIEPKNYWVESNIETPLSKFMAENPNLIPDTKEFNDAFAASSYSK